MKWNTKSIRILVIMLCFVLMPQITYAKDDPSKPAFSSPLDDTFNKENANNHIKYRENYCLDIIDGSILSTSDTIASVMNSIANFFFQLQVICAYMLITVFYYSFELDVYELLSGVVTTILNEMGNSIFNELALLAILLLGVFFVVKVIQNQRTQVWVAILQTALIVAIALYFFNNPMQILKQLDKGSKEISQSVLSGTFKANNNGTESTSAVMAAVDNIWSAYVHQPWQMLEFGNIKLAEKEENNILKYAPDSDERKEYIEKLAEDGEHFTPYWGGKRLALQLGYAVPLIIIFFVIFILCFFMIAYQILTILFTLLGAFVFVMALIPFFGTKILQNWFSKILSFAFIKVIICFCIGVMLAFMSAIFKVSEQYGWILTLLIDVIIVVTIIWKRESLIELFTFVRLAPQNPSMVNKQLRKDSNVELGISNASRYVGSKVTGFRKSDKPSDSDDSKGTSKKEKKKRKNNTDNESGEAKPEKIKSSSDTTDIVIKSDSNTETNDKNESPEAKDESNTEIKNTSKSKKKSKSQSEKNSKDESTNTKGGTSRQPYRNQLFDEMEQNQTEDNNNFKQLMKKAEEILEKQYEISKMESEKKAEQMNKEPEYSTFVNKVDTREALGAPKFEQREIVAVAKNLQRVIDSGGKAEDLLKKNEGKVATRETRPKDVISLVVNGQQQNMDKNEAYKIILQDASKEYAQEFNEDYGKKYDSKFMEGLIKRYGQQNVRLILNKMKDIQKNEGSIKNPAGYLTQSLKNTSLETSGSMRSKGAEKIE